jgi:hypothetical protein
MAFTRGTGTCAGSNKTAGTSVAGTLSTQNFSANELVVVVVGIDNTSTTDGATSEVSSITDSAGGNTWAKAAEFCNGQGAASGGAVVSIWWSVLVNAIPVTGGSITANLAASKTAKTICAANFTRDAAKTVSVVGSNGVPVDGATGLGSPAISGLTNEAHLFALGWAAEIDVFDAATATNYTDTGAAAHTSGGGAASNMDVAFHYRIATGTGDTVSSTGGSSCDKAVLLVAFNEVSSNTTAAPGTGQLALAGFAPTPNSTRSALPGVGALALTGLAPAAVVNIIAAPPTGQLALTGLAPAAVVNVIAAPGSGGVVITGFAPTVSITNNVSVEPGTGQLTLSGFAPAAGSPTVAASGTGQLALAGFVPTLAITENKFAAPGTAVLRINELVPIRRDVLGLELYPRWDDTAGVANTGQPFSKLAATLNGEFWDLNLATNPQTAGITVQGANALISGSNGYTAFCYVLCGSTNANKEKNLYTLDDRANLSSGLWKQPAVTDKTDILYYQFLVPDPAFPALIMAIREDFFSPSSTGETTADSSPIDYTKAHVFAVRYDRTQTGNLRAAVWIDGVSQPIYPPWTSTETSASGDDGSAPAVHTLPSGTDNIKFGPHSGTGATGGNEYSPEKTGTALVYKAPLTNTEIVAISDWLRTRSAPSVTVTNNIPVGVGQLALTGFAPTVSVSNNVSVTPGTGSVIMTGLAPTATITNNKEATPGTGQLILDGKAPDIGLNISVQPGTGQLALNGQVPTVVLTDNKIAAPGVGSLALIGFEPIASATNNQAVLTQVGTLILTGLAPTLAIGTDTYAEPGVGQLVLTGFAPVVTIASLEDPLTSAGGQFYPSDGFY